MNKTVTIDIGDLHKRVSRLENSDAITDSRLEALERTLETFDPDVDEGDQIIGDQIIGDTIRALLEENVKLTNERDELAAKLLKLRDAINAAV